MEYFRPPFQLNRPPLFQPMMEHFNFMHGPVPFHPSPPHFAMTTPAGIGLYLQRPPQPPPIHMPMLRGPGGPYVHSHAHTQHQQRDPRRQRPSKRVRQRMRRQPQRDDNESREDNLESIPLASESGYDTTGDCQTPATPLDSPLTANGESKFLTDGAKQTEGPAIQHYSLSDSTSSMNLSETSLKKLLKDLQRCDVSISKYQAMLDKNCEDGERNLQEMFGTLRDHLAAREQDLIQKLHSAKETAAAILQRRKSTVSFLRQAADNDEVTLDEGQLLELKHQIKCFVTDRKVDEDLGTTAYFKADPDDLIRHIKGFGKVSEAHQVYTVWEENPLDIINMSKGDKVPFSPTENDDDNDGGATKPLEESEQEATQLEEESLKSKPPESASDSITIDNQQQHNSTIESASSPSFEDSQPTVETDDSLVISKNPQSSNSVPLTLQQPSPQASQARSGCKSSVSSTDRHTYSYRVSATSSIKYTPKSLASIKSGRPWYAVSKVTTKRTASLTKHKEFTTPKAEVAKNRKLANDKSEQQKGNSSVPEGGGKKEERRDSSSRSKYSSSELQTIQSRIKDSLQQQGVYLYDPVTGDGPPSTTGTTGSTQFSTSSIDTSRERGKPSDQNNMALRRKKTPTQLRRERKKRQKERERRQRDLEKRNEGQFKQQTEDKDSETETKAAIRGECSKEGDNEDQKSSSPTSDSTTREGNSEQSTTTDHRSTLGDELSSSESEPHPESSRNNSQDHSPTHSTSSIEKSLDNDTTTGEEQRNHEANSHSQCSDGLGETNREEPAPTDEDVVFLEVISTGDKPRQLEDRVNNKERSPSLVVMTEEAASKVKINQESSHQATKTKTDASVLTAAYYEEKDNKPDGGMENGVAELELELKPEE